MTQEELLKQPETRDDNPQDQITESPVSLNFDRVKSLIQIRRQKLESVKSFIALKTHNLIADKIDREEKLLQATINLKKTEVAKQNVSQSLPKAFFEQGYMKIKNIRID
jgi:hypothetical protein